MRRYMLILFLVLLFAVGCEGYVDRAPAPDSDSEESFNGGAIPVDDGVYTIVLEVANDIESLTRQTEAASGSAFMYGGYGSASYFGPEFGGKGFVRGVVRESNSHLAIVGHMVVLKSSDTKAIMLRVGDVATFKCRHQYESVAAVRSFETFEAEKTETWEIDYCRLASPDLGEVVPAPTVEP